MKSKKESMSSPFSQKKTLTASNNAFSSIVPSSPLKNEDNMTLKFVNPENHQEEKKTQLFLKMIQANQMYLIDKVKVSDIPKPSQHSHKLPSQTGTTEYNRKYTTKGMSINQKGSVPERDQSGSVVKLPDKTISGYSSVYNQDYINKKKQDDSKLQNSQIALKNKKYERTEAPIPIQSSYKRDYGQVEQSPTLSAKREEIKLMGGGKLNSETTYKQYYRNKTCSSYKMVQPIKHKNNKIFISMDAPQISSYQATFESLPKQKQKVVESCKPVSKYQKSKTLKYKTEYANSYVSQSLVEKKEFGYMNGQQVKDYVMSILQQ